MTGIAIKDRVKEIALKYGVTTGMIEGWNETFNLAYAEVCYNTSNNKLLITLKENGGVDRSI